MVTKKPKHTHRSGKKPATTGDRDTLIATIKADFEQRLATLASQPHEWVEFIEQIAAFGARYSMANQLALMFQAAQRGITPTYFLPFGNKQGTSGWKRHGRFVRKGQTAFYVWSPIRRRPTEAQAQQWAAAASRTVLRDPDGRPAIQVVGFGLSPTYDLSQTDGAPFEPPTVLQRRRIKTFGGARATLLTGQDTTDAFDDVVKLIKDEGYGFELAAPRTGFLGDANGVTVGGSVRLVQVRNDVDPAQQVKTSVHELTHIRCGHLQDLAEGEDIHRGRRETEAESITHIVCRVLGLDTRAYSDAYVLTWADGDMNLIQQCGDKIVKVARAILADLTPDESNADPDASTGTGTGTGSEPGATHDARPAGVSQ